MPAAQIELAADPPSSGTRWLCGVGLAALLAVYLGHAARYWHYVNDDAYITFRYSRFLALGRGPYFNIGEHVEGYTNFLWMLLVAPVIALFGENAGPPFAKGLGIVCGALGVLLSAAVAAAMDAASRPNAWRTAAVSIVAAGLLSAAPGYAVNSTSGLETTLYGAMLTAGVFLGLHSLQTGRWRGCGLAFALAALTRPEGPLFFAIYWIAQVFCAKPGPVETLRQMKTAGWASLWTTPKYARHLLPDAAIVTAVVVGQWIFRLIAYDGQWTPNTFHAKAGGFWADARTYIEGGAVVPMLGVWGLLAALAGLFASKVQALRWFAPVALVAIAGAALPLVTGTDWMIGWRMIAPFLPLLAAVVAVGWCRLVDLVVRPWSRFGAIAVLAAIPFAWYAQSAERLELLNHSLLRARGYASGHEAMASWLQQRTVPGDGIALMDIGIVGYRCIDQTILDITGLTDRHIALSPGKFLDKQYDPAYILSRNPKFIVLVIAAGGDPEKPLPPDRRISEWTLVERKLRIHPLFQRYYARPRPFDGPASDWLTRLASSLGAERIFEHKHPGLYYLLAVYQRHG